MDPPAKAAAVAEEEEEATVGAQPPLPARSPGKGTTLLDVYEVEWITRELERLLVRESGYRRGGGGGRAGGDGHHRRKGTTTKAAAGSYTRPATDKGGFLTELLGRHAVSVCGDTAAGAAVVSGGRARRGRGSFREVEKV
uniref:Uncharacterized protein n=1 Tax=Oryza meridionalis TaxID=40149 RepID=A0A0E0CR55_9ORYZ